MKLSNSRIMNVIVLACMAFAAPLPGGTPALEKAPPVRPAPLAFVALPPGAVRPEGWLRDWAVAAVAGITGHLDERSNVFRDSWKGRLTGARGERPDGTGWPLEQSSYWLDGAIRLAYILDDTALKVKIGGRLDRVVDGVLAGGDSFIYWAPTSALDVPFNSWAHSHMGRALVGYYQSSGDPRVLAALVKVYRDFVLPDVNLTFSSTNGTVNIDPMIDTYLASGDTAILERVRAVARDPGYAATVNDWNAERITSGHAVIFYENVRVPALLHPWTGNQADLTATQRALAWLDRNHGMPTGLSSGEEHHAGIGATRNTETCNVTAAMWSYLWMLRITGEREHSDRIEQIFFNAAPAPVDRAFQTLSYYQMPNRYSHTLPAEKPTRPSSPDMKDSSYEFRPLGHPVLCCVANVNRVLPYFISHLWMGTPDGGLAATLYGPGTVNTMVGGQAVEVKATTDYPFDDTIGLRIKPARATAFPLYLRIPGWCRAPEITVNGEPVRISEAPDGFARITRTWHSGDEVRLRLPMPVVFEKGRETPYPQVPYFSDIYDTGFARASPRSLARDTAVSSPFAAVRMGPLLFSVPIADIDSNTAAPGARFQYALEIPPPGVAPDVEVVRAPMPRPWNWPLEAPLQLMVPMRRFEWRPTELQPLPAASVRSEERIRVRLVPYGSTKFRVTLLPIAAEGT